MIDSDNSPDLVEPALQALRVSAPSDGPPTRVAELTVARLRALSASAGDRSPLDRRTKMFRIARYSGIAAACLTLAVGGLWVGMVDRSAAVAFADVQAQVQKVQSAQYIERRLETIPAWQDLGPGAIRITGGDEYLPRRHLVLGRHLRRVEVLDPFGKQRSVHIYDARTGKSIYLRPSEKQAIFFTAQASRSATTGKVTETPIQPRAAPEADLYGEIREIPAGAARQLPVKLFVGDTETVGFLWEQKRESNGETDTWTRTYWIDPKTRLPLRIEISHRSTDKDVWPSDWVQSDFVFDEKLDEALFSTDAPAGYKVEEQKIHSLER